MGKLLEVSFMRQIKNDAFVSLYGQILNVMQDVDHNVSSETLERSVEKIQEHYALLRHIRAKDLVHELTDEIQAMHHKRYEAFRSIVHSMKSNMLHLNVENKSDANYFEKWFRKHSSAVTRGAQDILTRRIEDIEQSITEEFRIIETIENLGMAEIFNNLIELNNEFKKLLTKRTLERSFKKTLYVDTNQLRKDSIIELKILFAEIFRLTHWKEDGNAVHLEKALDDVLTRAKTAYEVARTRRANLRNPIEALNFKEYDWEGKDSVDYSVIDDDDEPQYLEAV